MQYGAAFAELTEPVSAALAKFYGLLQAKHLTLEDAEQLIEKCQPAEARDPEAASLTVSEAIELFFDDCKDGALEKGTMREYHSHLDAFAKANGNRLLKDINKKDITSWLIEFCATD